MKHSVGVVAGDERKESGPGMQGRIIILGGNSRSEEARASTAKGGLRPWERLPAAALAGNRWDNVH